ncbi:glycosyltransferase [Methanobacterium aggregans]|uniref:glycosyltransferase n=1 Tax=Methanobacterium aggregans TaxID=1615586 RepID=UPI001AE102F2|nr:glycosyltransferase [Methanobacterium aggregans]MBP2046668.1 glycosyltransferase involved in cell wall biosynthesis [Methanobacterium aggregans]
MNEIKVSVVIPVYNVEKYLKQCLESLINQTLSEIEIICVNDGSTDGSLEILEEYTEKDDRVRVINKKNGGIASARNRGMEFATGDYMGFVDSDDWIKLNMYEKLYENAQLYGSDIVMCSAHRFDDITHETCDLPYFTLERFDETFDNSIFTPDKTKDFFFDICVTPWNKLYKSKFLEETGVIFHEGLDFEDPLFFYETYLKASKLSLVRDFLYFYRVNRSGSFITSANERFFDIVEMFDLTEDVLFKTGNHNTYLVAFSNLRISNTLWRYDQVAEKYKAKFFDIIKENFKKMNPLCIDSLDTWNTKRYQNILNSNNYREYELLKKIDHLMEVQEEKEKQWHEELNNQKQKFVNEIQTQKQAYELDINAKNQLIQEITSSNSWKLTKPLRAIRKILKNEHDRSSN